MTRDTAKRGQQWKVYPQTRAGWIAFIFAALVGLVFAILVLAPGGPAVALAAGGFGFIGGAIVDAIRGRSGRSWAFGNGAIWLAVAVLLAGFGVGIQTHSADSPPAAVSPNSPSPAFITNQYVTNVRVTGPDEVTFEYTAIDCGAGHSPTNDFAVKLLRDDEAASGGAALVGGRVIRTGATYNPGHTYTVNLTLDELGRVDSTHHRIIIVGGGCSA